MLYPKFKFLTSWKFYSKTWPSWSERAVTVPTTCVNDWSKFVRTLSVDVEVFDVTLEGINLLNYENYDS